uniref:Spindle and centriole-associated protein 1 n=1 Tax=Rhabditophanes sp. KR3021 TaxID=114890 RepID=A0AC35TJ15_9BILA
MQSNKLKNARGQDEYPRQLIQVVKSNKSEDVVRTELRFVSYDLKANLESRFGTSEGSAVTQALWSLLAHLNKLNKDDGTSEQDLMMQKQILEMQLDKANLQLKNNEHCMKDMVGLLNESENVLKRIPFIQNRSQSPVYNQQRLFKNLPIKSNVIQHQQATHRHTKAPLYDEEQSDVVSSTYVHVEKKLCNAVNPGNGTMSCNVNQPQNDKVSMTNSMYQALAEISNRVIVLQNSVAFQNPTFKFKLSNLREMLAELKTALSISADSNAALNIKQLKQKFEALTKSLSQIYELHIQAINKEAENNGGFQKRRLESTPM